MGKAVTVDGCELEDTTGGGSVNVEGSPSTKDFADGKGIFFGAVALSVSGSDGGGLIGDGNGAGTGTITGTGSSICDGTGQPALLEDDTATINVTGTTTPPGGSPTPVGPVPVTVKVKKAGQDKVIAL